jgi:hypothetical protein
MSDNLQKCKSCGSLEVARLQWVNVNTNEVYPNQESGTDLEWCMDCKSETRIVEVIKEN